VDALALRGARIDNVVTAAAVGREDLVRSLVVDRHTLRGELPRRAPGWFRWPADPGAHIELALLFACGFGREPVATFLLDQGVDPAAKDGNAMTALHWAAAGRSMDLVKLLIGKGAPLEARNTWGGTVLDSTVWFAVNSPRTTPASSHGYPEVVETLLAAGADPGAVTPFPTGVPELDALLRRRATGPNQPPQEGSPCAT
jgi:hypothetical protein